MAKKVSISATHVLAVLGIVVVATAIVAHMRAGKPKSAFSAALKDHVVGFTEGLAWLGF